MSPPRTVEATAPTAPTAPIAPIAPIAPTALRRLRERALPILWPAFLMAGVLEALVFAVVDPAALHGFDGPWLRGSTAAVYTLAFLVFWAVVAAAGALTQWLDMPGDPSDRGHPGKLSDRGG